eukprot:scaffold32690_cov65-Phaeocystis_antarctica.AAC.1
MRPLSAATVSRPSAMRARDMSHEPEPECSELNVSRSRWRRASRRASSTDAAAALSARSTSSSSPATSCAGAGAGAGSTASSSEAVPRAAERTRTSRCSGGGTPKAASTPPASAASTASGAAPAAAPRGTQSSCSGPSSAPGSSSSSSEAAHDVAVLEAGVPSEEAEERRDEWFDEIDETDEADDGGGGGWFLRASSTRRCRSLDEPTSTLSKLSVDHESRLPRELGLPRVAETSTPALVEGGSDVLALLGWCDDDRRARRRGRPAAEAEAAALVAFSFPLLPGRTAPRMHRLARAAPRRLRPRPQPCAHIEVVRRRQRPRVPPWPRLEQKRRLTAEAEAAQRRHRRHSPATIAACALRLGDRLGLGLGLGRRLGLEIERRLGHTSLGVPPPQPQLHARHGTAPGVGGVGGGTGGAAANTSTSVSGGGGSGARVVLEWIARQRGGGKREQARSGRVHVQLQARLGAHVVRREQPQLDELRRTPLVGAQALGRRLLRRYLRQHRRRRLGRARVGAAAPSVDEHVAAAALRLATALVIAGCAAACRIAKRVRRRRLHTRVVELEPLLGATSSTPTQSYVSSTSSSSSTSPPAVAPSPSPSGLPGCPSAGLSATADEAEAAHAEVAQRERQVDAVVQLAVPHLDGVIRKALELQHQQRRQRLEADALERADAPLARLAPPGIVAAVERLPAHEALKRLFHRAHVGDAELHVTERLGAHTLVAAPAAAHRRAQPPFEELHDRRRAARHARRARTLERLEEHTAQLLDIVLPEAVGLTPPERRGELAGREGDLLCVLHPRE